MFGSTAVQTRTRTTRFGLYGLLKPRLTNIKLLYGIQKASKDELFSYISNIHYELNPRSNDMGNFLDAGTGRHSLQWICSQKTVRWTAVTADAARQFDTESEFSGFMRPGDRVVYGNWKDVHFLHGEVYDVVLLDYLLGAIEGFSPYFQDQLFDRLAPHIGGHMYMIGLEPYPKNPDSPGGHDLLDVIRLRDAVLTVSGKGCYREYPLDWVLRHLDRAGYVIDHVKVFPITYGEPFAHSQIDVARRHLDMVEDPVTRDLFAKRIEQLHNKTTGMTPASFGEHYIIAAHVDHERREKIHEARGTNNFAAPEAIITSITEEAPLLAPSVSKEL
eukprot:TRINITY_DN4816_c0_g1_i1.p1 TRINITY_DN4816_c0_g1~~TRINITY_DN4816_c0_g1_i1.p1  ORF type:complete len:331 (-),score=58.95 TRINITY_DN4816_c0_g1_i1:25-1017(-)